MSDGTRRCAVVLPPIDPSLTTRVPENMADYCGDCVFSALSYFAHPWFVLPQSDLHAAFSWRDEDGASAHDPMVISWRVYDAFDSEAQAARRRNCDEAERGRLQELHASRAQDQRRFHVMDQDLARHSLAHPSGFRFCEAVLPTDLTGVAYDDAEVSGDLEYEEDRFCIQCSETLLAWAALDSTIGSFVDAMSWVNGLGVLTDQEPESQRAARVQIQVRSLARLRLEVEELRSEMQIRFDELQDTIKNVSQPVPIRHKRPWDDDEQTRLIALYRAGMGRSEIALELQRKESAITKRVGVFLMLASPTRAFTDAGYPAFPDLDVPEDLWRR